VRAAVPPRVGWKGFATRPLGQIVLLAIAILVVGAGAIFLGWFIGIFLILLFGLVLPIYLGLKVPNRLAILGILILLLAAPVGAVLYADVTFQPPGAAQSYGEQSGYVLQNAKAMPYSGGAGQNYSFVVTVYPEYRYPNTTLANLTLFISTCPNAIAANDSLDCATPYPSYNLTQSIAGLSNTTSYTFHQRLPGENIYWWIMWATFVYASNHTECRTNCIFLASGSSFTDIEGPITTSFLGVVGIVLPAIYLDILLYPGIAFFGALVFYAWFKARERRRKAAQAVGLPPSGGSPSTGGTVGGTGAGGPAGTGTESRCPKCNAVVYAPPETQCWKCGAPLTPGATPSSAPLPSGPSPPTQGS
jgi:hypothetical protein